MMMTKYMTNCCLTDRHEEPRECGIANAELRLEPFDQNVVINGVERRRYV